jgi:hypothetical protein
MLAQDIQVDGGIDNHMIVNSCKPFRQGRQVDLSLIPRESFALPRVGAIVETYISYIFFPNKSKEYLRKARARDIHG